MNKLVKAFKDIQNITYSIPLKYNEENNSCSGKVLKLKEAFLKLNIKSRYVVCTFKWSDLRLPKEVMNKVTNDKSTHVYLEVLIDGNWYDCDPTWDLGLINTKLPVISTWDGNSNTQIGVKLINKFSYEDSQKIMSSKWTKNDFQKDFQKNGNFYISLNKYLEQSRKRSQQ